MMVALTDSLMMPRRSPMAEVVMMSDRRVESKEPAVRLSRHENRNRKTSAKRLSGEWL
jgi:hypothetical protein